MSNQATHTSVQEYYGQILKSKDDLQTAACCTADATPERLKPYLAKIHDDIQNTFYGCGTPVPRKLEGCTVLDLGCGTGRDAYLLSQLVGESGHIIGLDMTDEQLDKARAYEDWHADTFGFEKPNTKFVKGYIEDLKAAGIEDNSIDVIISNCVINLSPDKRAVFEEASRVLKPGGELFFSDVFADTRMSAEQQADPVLFGECLSGALHMDDFDQLMSEIGYKQYKIISDTPFAINNPEIEEKLANISFFSKTIRATKNNPSASCCDDPDPYGCEDIAESGCC